MFKTKSWINTSKHTKRQNIVNKLNINKNIKSRKADDKKVNEGIIILDTDQRDKLKDILNSYKFTLNSVLMLLKGSNPSGSYSIPSNAEVFTEYKNVNYNITLIIDNMTKHIKQFDYIEDKWNDKHCIFSDWINFKTNIRSRKLSTFMLFRS